MAKKKAAAKKPLTRQQKALIITDDLTALLVKWNDEGVIVVRETNQIAAVIPLVAATIQAAIALRR